MSVFKLKQFAVSFLVVLSLFVSSVSAACVCDDHYVQGKTGEYCQTELRQHKHEIEKDSWHQPEEGAESHHSDGAQKDDFVLSDSDDECCCFQPAHKVFAKSERTKAEKQVAHLADAPRMDADLIQQIVSVKNIVFAAPSYLSDSFYSLSPPGRAPPVW